MVDGGGGAIRRRLIVHGRVQGVFFRGATADEARLNGVSGFVRNRTDGAVEAVFEGPFEAVELMVRFCRRGPPAARVDRIDLSEEPVAGLQGFQVEF